MRREGTKDEKGLEIGGMVGKETKDGGEKRGK